MCFKQKVEKEAMESEEKKEKEYIKGVCKETANNNNRGGEGEQKQEKNED